MSKGSAIEWCDHTFNPWTGCTKISEGCDHCYAELIARRFKRGSWGPKGVRAIASDKVFDDPLRWHRQALRQRRRFRVFCMSMGDLFEEHPAVIDARTRTFEIIEQTSRLDWLLLTKRPHNINAMVPSAWSRNGFPRNVAVGTTIESPQVASRLHYLLQVKAHMRFLSMEPLLKPTNIGLAGDCADMSASFDPQLCDNIDWVIVGGESGRCARPMHPYWAEHLRVECAGRSVPFFFKQWGSWVPTWKHATHLIAMDGAVTKLTEQEQVTVRTSKNPEQDIAMPGSPHGIANVGKKRAGARLFGAEYKEFPKQSHMRLFR